MDTAVEVPAEELPQPVVESEEASDTVQDEAAGVTGGAADSVADGAKGDTATEALPAQRLQAPALPLQPGRIRSGAHEQATSMVGEVLLQPSIGTDEAPAGAAGRTSAGSAVEPDGSQGADPAPSVSAGLVPRTAVQTVLPTDGDGQPDGAAVTEPSAGDSVGVASAEQLAEGPRGVDVLLTSQRAGPAVDADRSALQITAAQEGSNQGASPEEDSGTEEDSRTEEPYPESDRGGAAASYSSVAEQAGAASAAEDGAGTSSAEPGAGSDGERPIA